MAELDQMVDKIIASLESVIELQKTTQKEIKKAQHRNEKFKEIVEKKIILNKNDSN